ncbi:MAG: hypothetical protein ACKOKE_03140, partial [Actinomycetota bacterium]
MPGRNTGVLWRMQARGALRRNVSRARTGTYRRGRAHAGKMPSVDAVDRALRTPIPRRSILRGGGAGIAALGLGPLLAACGGGGGGGGGARPPPPARP